jgi:hypothetical protein
VAAAPDIRAHRLNKLALLADQVAVAHKAEVLAAPALQAKEMPAVDFGMLLVQAAAAPEQLGW